MATYGTKGGKITYTMSGQGGAKGIPTSAPGSQAARDFASQPKSKAIRDPKLGYGGSSEKKRSD
jgi:hypothetical protein